MNEQLEGILVTYLQKVLAGLDQGVEFMSEQLPEVVEQTLTWYCVYYAILFFGALFVIIGTARFLYNMFVKNSMDVESIYWEKSSYGGGVEPSFAGGMGLMILSVLAFFSLFVLCNTIEWLQIIIAPKLWLIEYVADLAK